MAGFLIAQLCLEDADATASWLADESHATWQELDPIDVDDALVARIFELYRLTYRDLGEPFLNEPEALFKYSRWVLFYDGADRGATSVIACALFDVTPCGLKGRLRASNLSTEGKAVTKKLAVASYNAPQVFGEISGRLEVAIIDKVHVVHVSDAVRVLGKLGHVATPTTGNHYERTIHGERTSKVMVGYPRIPDEGEVGTVPPPANPTGTPT